jgi:prepilin peptidase CpaA
VSGIVTIGSGAAFVAMLAAAAVSDARTRRIPNALVAAIALLGVAVAVVAAPWPAGLERAALGALTGLALWLPFHLLGWMGAGDVKLFAAASVWLGPAAAVRAALLTALLGGVLALGWAAWLRVRRGEGERRLPYGIAMAAALAVAAWW